jgi:DNA-binding transcriptional MerR regulator
MSVHSTNWKDVGQIGLYTVPMAARILRDDSIRVGAWINGAQHSGAPPIIQRQLPRIGGKTVLGFLDLIEARFIKHFRDLGLSAQSIRKFAAKLRERHHTDHPFAMNKAFRTDGKTIFMETVETDEEKRILNLLNDNFEMEAVIEASLFDSILYADDLAYRLGVGSRQGRMDLEGHEPRASPVGIASAVVIDSALRRRYPVSCALQVGNGVLPRLQPRAFLARSLRRPPGEDGRLELLPSRYRALRLSQRIPPIKHIRRAS